MLVKIECKTTFLHDRDRYEAGDIRAVDDELGRYFIKQGWAAIPGEAAAPQTTDEVTLDVQKGRIGTGDRHG